MPPPTYSHSRLSTFDQCAKRFRYQYLDRVQQAFVSVEGFMGRQVHATIEWLFAERLAGREHDATAAVEHYCAAWDQSLLESMRPIRVVRVEEASEQYRRLGAELVATFHRDRYVTDPLNTVAIEKHFDVRLAGGHRLQGYIDRLARDGSGRVHVIDYKTGKRAPKRFEGKDAEQLEAYALAVFDELGADLDEVILVLEFLRTMRTLRSRVTRAELPRIEERICATIDVVEAATVFPPSPGPLCHWCGYNDVCDSYGRGENRTTNYRSSARPLVV
jgi:putative RecB family exonuclease